MTVKIQDVLKADIVLLGVGLLRTQQGLDTFLKSVGKEAVIEPLNPGTQPAGIRIAFNRERISVMLSPGRSIIAKDYPELSELDQLADIAIAAIDHTHDSDERLVAVGFNVEVVYDQDSGMTASAYISERLLSDHAFKSDGWQLTVGANRTSVEPNGLSINQSVAPRFNDVTSTKVFTSLNLHAETNMMPSHPEIVASLRHAWNSIHEFPVRFDEG